MKKVMRKVLKYVFAFILLFMVMSPVVTFAVEITADGAEINNNTIFTRVWEFVKENRTEVISGAGSLVLLIVNAITKRANKKANKGLSDQLLLVQEDSSSKNEVLSSIINAINQMITGFNKAQISSDKLSQGYDEMRAAYEKNAYKEDDRNRLIGAVMVQNTAILEMLASVYVHNKNIPQGVKDIVVLTYANTLKALSDDELLCAIVESVREKVKMEGNAEEGDIEVVSKEPGV